MNEVNIVAENNHVDLSKAIAEIEQSFLDYLKLKDEQTKTSEEEMLRSRYPHLNIIEGSLIQEKDNPIYGSKRRVRVVCQCGAVVERSTSDLHTFIGCPPCKKAIAKANKLAKKTLLVETTNKA